MSLTYSKKVISHFRKPHNFGKIKNPTAVGKVGNVVCGDVMYLYLQVEGEVIKNVKFETYGCAAAIATSSVVTDLAKGKTLEAALKLTPQNVIESLDGLPAIKIHCSLLALDALGEAVYDYWTKVGKKIPQELEEKHQRIEAHEKHGHEVIDNSNKNYR